MANDLTPEQLAALGPEWAALAELATAATPGPWMMATDATGSSFAVKSYARGEQGRYVAAADHEMTWADAEYITAACNAIPALLAVMADARLALQFYAEPTNWLVEQIQDWILNAPTKRDNGERARQALGR